jgi:PAS domain S-box-containing protein
MRDQNKTKSQLVDELRELRKRNAELEKSEIKHKKTEEALKLKARLLDSINDSIFLCDLKGNIEYINKAASRAYGLSKEELLDVNIKDFAQPEQKKFIDMTLSQLRDKSKLIFEATRLLKNGSTIHVEVNARVIKSDGRDLILSVSRDITERKKAEEERKVYNAGIEMAYDGIAFTKLNGDMLYFNKAACKIFGYAPDEMKKINISKFSATLGARKKLEESVREKGWFSGEIMGVRKNGEKFPAILSVSIINDEKGEPTGRMGVFRDFTERKQVEEEANRCVFR